MKKEDTLDYGPNKLLLKTIDLENYRTHRHRLAAMESVNKISDGSHIKKINNGKAAMID